MIIEIFLILDHPGIVFTAVVEVSTAVQFPRLTFAGTYMHACMYVGMVLRSAIELLLSYSILSSQFNLTST